MGYNPKLHHRRSIRLKEYDYSQEGLYFITLCAQNKECLFGHIVNHQMILNDAGNMVEKWVKELKNKYPNIDYGEYMVMPNHFHCIVEIVSSHKCANSSNALVGAPLCGRPNDTPIINTITGNFPVSDPSTISMDTTNKYGIHNQQYNATIGNMLDWFKTMSTNEYIRGVKTMNWQRFDGKLWQRNYWEHVIRNQQAYETISNYIIANPANWNEDKFYKQ
ncbi:MAG: hypothetical protein H7X84_00745 [Verrucomicrobia bacterium]|nr:hypothetical protein [Prolixibacteraceae bacterium]